MSWTAEMMGIDIKALRAESPTDLSQLRARRLHEARSRIYWGNQPPAYEIELTLAQAAKLISYSKAYLLRLAQDGKIPAYKVDGKWFIARGDALNFLATRR